MSEGEPLADIPKKDLRKVGYLEMLSGIFPSITTPFVNGEVELAKLAFNIQRYNQLDLGGYMILGGNGENLGLTEKETFGIVETILKNAKANRTIIAGAGKESAKATVDYIKALAQYDIDIASVITPFYFAKHMGDKNLIAYFQRVADESPIPILIYNSPDYAAGVDISPQAISVLSRHENIVGMKNSSGRELSIYKAEVDAHDTFYFHSGKVSNCYRDFEQGAVGATLSMAIYWPEVCIHLYNLYKQGRGEQARRLNDQLSHINKAGVSKYGVSGVKCAMDMMGYFGGEPRLPLLSLTTEQKEEIKRIIH